MFSLGVLFCGESELRSFTARQPCSGHPADTVRCGCENSWIRGGSEQSLETR